MNLKEINDLPDYLSTETLASYYHNVLENYETGKFEKGDFLSSLIQLTDRQVMTYELLKEEIRSNVDEVLCKLWNIDSYEDVDTILSIVVNLGLVECFKIISTSINDVKNEKILNEITDTINEVGDNISNPYHDLEKLRGTLG
ncbi:hypothetical protein [Paenibacillus gorillae]|uniref:hypothetical protein n=1 Tax=Paenibacillus gorillae TaxID=1243662 RepID=UPI0004BC9F09|nr:hypothetical protein [Paenibacillus gorillae]